MSWSFRFQTDAFGGERKLYMRERSMFKNASYVTSFNMEEHVEGETVIPAAYVETQEQVEDNYQFFQPLLDCLWDAGFRPQGNRDYDREQQHLKDLRIMLNLEGTTSKVVKIER
ncbi:MAG: hypothetical protein HOE83_00085 [Alphaproteobacteria bacterium]|jgi:hypothetical protein|nr:hypothetical protein [Alphaproteobacteria bacterium]